MKSCFGLQENDTKYPDFVCLFMTHTKNKPLFIYLSTWCFFFLQCLSAEGLGINMKTLLNETGFAAKAPMIVYSLMPEKNSGQSNKSCDGIPSLPSKLFEALVHNFTDGNKGGITQHALEHILEKINITLGPHLNNKKVCKMSY